MLKQHTDGKHMQRGTTKENRKQLKIQGRLRLFMLKKKSNSEEEKKRKKRADRVRIGDSIMDTRPQRSQSKKLPQKNERKTKKEMLMRTFMSKEEISKNKNHNGGSQESRIII